MKPTRFEIAIALIDKKNSEDPNSFETNGLKFPKELIYSQRMSKKLLQFKPNASRALQIAARAQHICRWKIGRKEYPMDRVGYLKWRETLKKMHADITSDILKEVNYDDELFTLLDNGRLTTDSGYTVDNIEESPNINFSTWNIDLSYSWQFAPGSFLTALYRNQLFNFDTMSEDSYSDSLNTLFDQPIQNTFSLRVQYFIDFNGIKSVFKGNKSAS